MKIANQRQGATGQLVGFGRHEYRVSVRHQLSIEYRLGVCQFHLRNLDLATIASYSLSTTQGAAHKSQDYSNQLCLPDFWRYRVFFLSGLGLQNELRDSALHNDKARGFLFRPITPRLWVVFAILLAQGSWHGSGAIFLATNQHCALDWKRTTTWCMYIYIYICIKGKKREAAFFFGVPHVCIDLDPKLGHSQNPRPWLSRPAPP